MRIRKQFSNFRDQANELVYLTATALRPVTHLF